MKALIMLDSYINEILDGIKKNDVRTYGTKTRGTILLISSEKSQIIGFVDLISVNEISMDEYVSWHKTGKYKNMDFKADLSKSYYSYNFENPRYLDYPIKITKTSHSWMDVDDSLLKGHMIRQTLF